MLVRRPRVFYSRDGRRRLFQLSAGYYPGIELSHYWSRSFRPKRKRRV